MPKIYKHLDTDFKIFQNSTLCRFCCAIVAHISWNDSCVFGARSREKGSEVSVDLIRRELRSPIVFLLAMTISGPVPPQRDLYRPLRAARLTAINNPISVSMLGKSVYMCVCVCGGQRVCNCTPLIEATNGGKCSCLTSSMHHLLPPPPRLWALLARHTCLHLAPVIFSFFSFFFSHHPFIFAPVLVRHCVSLSVDLSPTLINWFVLWESLSPHSLLITVNVSVSLCVCRDDR